MSRDELIQGMMPGKNAIETIKNWRKKQYDAGLPSGYKEFYKLNDICETCKGRGFTFETKMVRVGEDVMRGQPYETIQFEPTEKREQCTTCGGHGHFIGV